MEDLPKLQKKSDGVEPEPKAPAGAFGSGSFVPPPENPGEKSSLDELEKRLYKRANPPEFEAYRSRMRRTPSVANRTTGRASVRLPEPGDAAAPLLSPLERKVLYGAVVLFLVVLGFFAYIFFGGTAPVIDNEAVAVSVSGPVSVSGGSPASFQLIFENRGRDDIAESDMVVLFPPGTRDPSDPTKELTRLREDVGALRRGESVSKTVKAIFFGEENASKEVAIEYDYQAVDSNATYRKTKTYSVVVSGSPVVLTSSLPAKTSSGRTVSFELKLASNSSLPLGNLLVTAQFPPGFSLTGSMPESLPDMRAWEIGALPVGAVKTVRFEGVLVGEDAESKLFRFEVGTAKPGSGTILAPYGALESRTELERPALGLATFLAGNPSPTASLADGREASLLLSVSNNTSEPIEDVVVEAHLVGELVNPAAVAASRGLYQSLSRTVKWDSSTFDSLKRLAPGESMDLDLVIGTFSANRTNNIVLNPTFSVEIEATGKRTVVGSGRVIVDASATRKVNINTLVSFTSRGLYSTGAFANTGPYPPKAEKETTYTITWTIANTSNALSQALVTAKLPPGVVWKGNTAPTTETLEWNEASREVSWRAGAVAAKTGYAGVPRQVSFQVALTPSLTQVGETPLLVEGQRFTARDNFTNATVEGIKNGITTELLSDPAFKGDGKVTK